MPLIVSGYITRADGSTPPLGWRVEAADLAIAVSRARALAQEADTVSGSVPVAGGDVVITMIEETAPEPVATVRAVASAVRPMAKGRP